MGPTINTTWKRSRKGGYKAQVELVLALPEYDIRRKGPMKGREVKRFTFEGSILSKEKQPNRRVPFPRGAEIGLDVKRAHLELRWEKKDDYEWPWFCHYELIVPLVAGGVLRTALGGTRRGGDGSPLYQDGKIDTPFRDGAHAHWDGEALGLKIFAVYGAQRMEVIPKAAKVLCTVQ